MPPVSMLYWLFFILWLVFSAWRLSPVERRTPAEYGFSIFVVLLFFLIGYHDFWYVAPGGGR